MKFLFRLFVLVVIIATGTLFYGYNYVTTNTTAINPSDKSDIIFQVKDGIALTSVLRSLEEKKIIKDYKAARIYSLIYFKNKQIKPGFYQISKSMSFGEIFEKFASGKVYQIWLTIPEGFSIKKIAKRITNKNLSEANYIELAKTINNELKEKYEFLNDLDNNQTLEGYLFPDTYDITGATEEDLFKAQLRRFEGTIYKAWQDRPSSWNMSLHETLTLASIVELEAQKPSERETIAGVFMSRLKQQIPLGSDPTVEYALGWHQDAKGLSFNDVKVSSPYNTYRNAGLPPGPIANPGLAAFKAVLNYERTPYLYFVAKGDGSHVFTRTYPEHLNAQSMIIRGLIK